MPYILNKTNGDVLTIVQDATIDNTTGLTFVGKNYSGYGQFIEENFVYLLENFANTTPPVRKVQGQFWFNNDTALQRMKVCYDGVNFRDANNVPIGLTAPAAPALGDMWWDTTNNQLKVYISNGWLASSPYGGASSSWNFDKIRDTAGENHPAIKGLSGYKPMVIFSNTGTYLPSTTTNISTTAFPVIKAGIVLPYADPYSGRSASSTTTGALLWGTAADSLSSQASFLTPSRSTSTFYIPFAGTITGTQKLYTTSTFSLNLNTGVLNVIASAAQYADLAERYEADAEYEVGTVLVIGGEKEVTVTATFADTRVAGIVSKNPAYMMNSEAGSDKTHPYIALKGRVPCKVQGYIKKGDLIVTSSTPGYGIAASNVFGGAIIGKALGTQSEGFGVIEVLVV